MATKKDNGTPGAALHGDNPEARREAARLMGKASTPAKAAAARENLQKAPPKPLKRLLDIPCSCEGGDSLELKAHKSTCRRYRTIKRRLSLGQPLT
jgi:hypothetical protein